MAEQARVQLGLELKDGTPLRRYLDLAKYIDLLRSRSLYLCRADQFSDRFEGALTPVLLQSVNAKATYRRCRMGTFVSCWTLGAKDNMALWQLYGGATSSVAINTTVQRLTITCHSWNKPILIQKVRYIDHFENPDMVIGRYTDPLEFKHEAYEFEREVRIILPQQDNWENNPEGMYLPVSDLNSLVTSVVVAPEAGSWFYELVKDVTSRYGLKAEVRMSKLAALPE